MSENTIEKQRQWLLPEGKNLQGPPGLYIVSTPIGNMGDITLRALDVLAGVDVVVCEDTRVSKKLLSHYGIKKPTLSYNDHSGEKQRNAILEKLAGGSSVALVSDAGAPLISDPGYKLVRECLDREIAVTSIPGPSATIAALQLSGLPTDKFCFAGFLPPKSGARQSYLAKWKDVDASLVIFETAPRLIAALQDVQKVLGERQVAVVREITKLYEQSRSASIAEMIEVYEEEGTPKGEIVIVVGPPPPAEWSEAELKEKLRGALSTMGTKEASAAVSEETGVSRKRLYEMALGLDDDGE